MTVKELIDKLATCPPDAVVEVYYDNMDFGEPLILAHDDGRIVIV